MHPGGKRPAGEGHPHGQDARDRCRGLIGRHLTRALLEAGHEVHAVDSIRPLTGAVDPAAGWPLFEPRDYHGFHFHREDCRDWFRRNPDQGFDVAFHLAAMVGGRLMIENNPLAVADDLGIDAAFFQWAAQARPGPMRRCSAPRRPIRCGCSGGRATCCWRRR